MTLFRRTWNTLPWPDATWWITILIVIVANIVGQTSLSQALKPSNRLTIQNDSGQFALVKTVGPTRAVVKIPLDQKKTVHLAPGQYYILVRIGFAPKEFIYTKGETFTVTQEEDKFSLTTITLHRIVSGMNNPHEVSGEEFKNFTLSKGKKKAASEKKRETKD